MVKVLCFGICLVQLMLASIISFEAIPGLQSNQTKAIDHIKHLEVSRLDPKLSRVEFESWFASILDPETKIVWELNDCGEQTGGGKDSGGDIPTALHTRSPKTFRIFWTGPTRNPTSSDVTARPAGA